MDDSRSTSGTDDNLSEAELRRRVEEKYDFDNFTERDMAEMTPEEWEVAFDHDSWVTGEVLLDRVEAELKHRIASREVFAAIERDRRDGEAFLLAYSDTGYAVVYEDGSVEGRGTVLSDVKATVAMVSIPEFDVPEPPDDAVLPDPADISSGSGDLGNLLIQVIAGVHVVAGLALLVTWIAFQLNAVAFVAAVGFVVFGVFLFVVVANARLSDRFRAEEYRDRLRMIDRDPETVLAELLEEQGDESNASRRRDEQEQ